MMQNVSKCGKELLINENSRIHQTSDYTRLYQVSLSGCSVNFYSEYSEFFGEYQKYLSRSSTECISMCRLIFRLTKRVCCNASSVPTLSMCQCEAVETAQVAQDPLAFATLRAQGTIGTLSRVSCIYKIHTYLCLLYRFI